MSPKGKPVDKDVGLVAFGEMLTEVMKARGISQAALGELVDRAQTTVSEWVRGQAEPLPSTVFCLEKILDLAPGQLSRYLGYVPISVLEEVGSVEAALRTDPTLDDAYRRSLLASYREYQRARNEIVHGASLHRRQDPKRSAQPRKTKLGKTAQLGP